MVDNPKDEKIIQLQEKLEVLTKKIINLAICSGAATFIFLTVRLIFIFISNCKLFRGLRGASHIFDDKKGLNLHSHYNQNMDKIYLRFYLFSKRKFITVIITISLSEGLSMAVVLTLAFLFKN